MYSEYARDTFTQWVTVSRREDFTLDLGPLLQGIEREHPSIILLTSPNNPTGIILSTDNLAAVLRFVQNIGVAGAAEDVHPVVVVDEAYIEFRDPGVPSALELLFRFGNLAVSRTMSKVCAFAGARLGYLTASTGIIDCVRIVCMPCHLSASPRRRRSWRSNTTMSSSARSVSCVASEMRPQRGLGR